MSYLFIGSNDNEQRWSIKCKCGNGSWYIDTTFLFQCTNCSNRVHIEKVKLENNL